MDIVHGSINNQIAIQCHAHRDRQLRSDRGSRRPLLGAQSERSRQNFRIGHDRMPIEIIHALGIVKLAAAETNRELGLLDQRRARAIVRAAREVIEGKLDDHFPLVVWQTGSGTQTNMNLNEVIANRANELLGGKLGAKQPVHPNDHVNMSQSSNDSFPTAMHIAAAMHIVADLIPALSELHGASQEGEGVRSHRQDRPHPYPGRDAVDARSGIFRLRAQVDSGIARLRVAVKDLYPLAQGGTAVGTGLNSKPRFAGCLQSTPPRLPNCPSPAPPINSRHWPPTTPTYSCTAPSIRWRPACSRSPTISACWARSAFRLGELILPENEPGSSIMPGKVNPTQCEAMTMVCCQVFGNHTPSPLPAARAISS